MQSLFEQAQKAHQSGDLDSATKLYQTILAESPDHPGVLHLLGLIAFEKQAYPSALDLFMRAYKLDPDTPEITFSLACTLHIAGRPAEAVPLYEKAIQLMPDHPEIWINLANAERELKHYAFSESAFLKAPDTSLKWMNMGLLYQDQKRNQEAEECFKKATMSASPPADAFYHLANFLRDTGRPAMAEPYYERAISLNPLPAYYNSYGICLEHRDLNAALIAYQRAGDYPEAIANQGALLGKLGQKADAERLLRRAVELDPQNVSALNNLANFLMRENLIQEALECYRRAVLKAPNDPILLHNLATLIRRSGDLEEAAGLYLKALSIQPLDATHLNLASTLYELSEKNKPAAENAAKLWLKAFPHNAIASYIANVLMGKSFDRADPAYLRQAFDSMAESYNTHIRQIKYDMTNILNHVLEDIKSADILDVGCGTGLYAPLLKPHANQLIGLDLSSKMIAEAAKTGLYDNLIIGDFLTQPKLPTFNVLFALEICCYIGPLDSFFKKCYDCLRDDGKLFFTVESGDKIMLAPSGRFKHDIDSTVRAIKAAGLTLSGEPEEITLREEFGQKVPGYFFTVIK